MYHKALNLIVYIMCIVIFVLVIYFSTEYAKSIRNEYSPTPLSQHYSYKRICLGNHWYWRGLKSDVLALVVNDNGMPIRCKKLPFEMVKPGEKNVK